MEKVYENGVCEVFRNETSNGFQLSLLECDGGMIALFECWANGSESYCEPIWKSDFYDSHKSDYDYFIKETLKKIESSKSVGEYQSTYDRISEYTSDKKALEERLQNATDDDEREYLSEQIAECELSIDECEGYLRELDYIDNGTQYW